MLPYKSNENESLERKKYINDCKDTFAKIFFFSKKKYKILSPSGAMEIEHRIKPNIHMLFDKFRGKKIYCMHWNLLKCTVPHGIGELIAISSFILTSLKLFINFASTTKRKWFKLHMKKSAIKSDAKKINWLCFFFLNR